MTIFKQTIGLLGALCLGLVIWAFIAPASFRGVLQPVSFGLIEARQSASMTAPEARGGARGGMRGGSEVRTARVEETVSNALVQTLGTGVAEKSITLFAQSAGRVREVLFRAGERVKEGQTLLRLDDEEQQIAVEQVKIKLETARMQVERFQQLAKSQAVTLVQLQDAGNAVQTLENELAGAELALSRRSVIAPFSGVTGFAQISIGDVITTTSAITTLDDRSILHVRFAAPERYAARLSVGDALTATSAAFGDEVFKGVIESIDSRIDPVARTMTVRALFPNEDDRLRPGMSFAVTIHIDGERRLAVPPLAVQWDREGAFVWKLIGSQVRRVDVSVLDRTPASVLVSGDLAAADRVVTEGVQMLRDGAEVKAADAPEISRTQT